LRRERDPGDYLRDIARYAEIGERMVEGSEFEEFVKMVPYHVSMTGS
jgi:hypothetical protein